MIAALEERADELELHGSGAPRPRANLPRASPAAAAPAIRAIAAEQYRPRDRRGAEAVAHLVERRVQRGCRAGRRRAARAAAARGPRGWRAPRRSASPRARGSAAGCPPSSPRAAARIRVVCDVASRSVCDRVARREVVEAQPQADRPAHAPRRPQPPREPVDQRDEHRVELGPAAASTGRARAGRRSSAGAAPRAPGADRGCGPARAGAGRRRARACREPATSGQRRDVAPPS